MFWNNAKDNTDWRTKINTYVWCIFTNIGNHLNVSEVSKKCFAEEFSLFSQCTNGSIECVFSLTMGYKTPEDNITSDFPVVSINGISNESDVNNFLSIICENNNPLNVSL